MDFVPGLEGKGGGLRSRSERTGSEVRGVPRWDSGFVRTTKRVPSDNGLLHISKRTKGGSPGSREPRRGEAMCAGGPGPEESQRGGPGEEERQGGVREAEKR